MHVQRQQRNAHLLARLWSQQRLRYLTKAIMKYAVLGGGIAGVCCAEELCKLCPQDSITLVPSDKTLKVSLTQLCSASWATCGCDHRTLMLQGVGNVVKYTDKLEQFESKPKWACACAQPTTPKHHARTASFNLRRFCSRPARSWLASIPKPDRDRRFCHTAVY